MSTSWCSFDNNSLHAFPSLLLLSKWTWWSLLVLRYIQIWVVICRLLQLSNIWSGSKLSTPKCKLLVIFKLRYIIMRYSYQTRHLFNCRDNFSNSYFNDELVYMNGGVLQDPTEPLDNKSRLFLYWSVTLNVLYIMVNYWK